MRTLITGGAGFIGSHLAEELLAQQEEVFIIDDLSTGNINNIEHLKDNKKFHYTIDSIMNYPLMAELIDKCDITYHLAAAVGVRLIVDDPVRTIKTNINGTEIVLSLASKKNKKVLITSTSEVYGKNKQVPFKEESDLLLGPTTKRRWSYACSKIIDEFLALAYFKEKNLPIVIARLFNTIGPRQTGRYGMVLPTFVCQAMKNKPITVYGDGTQTRSFSYVDDVVKALIDLSKCPDAIGEVFNIGSDEEISIKDLALKIKKITKSSSDIIYVPYDQAYEKGFEDMRRRVPDISKIKKAIEFKPTKKIDEVIKEIIEYQNSIKY